MQKPSSRWGAGDAIYSSPTLIFRRIKKVGKLICKLLGHRFMENSRYVLPGNANIVKIFDRCISCGLWKSREIEIFKARNDA